MSLITDSRPSRDPLLSIRDAARRLNVGLRTMRALIASGAISAVRVSARRLAIDPVDLEAYIASRRSAGGAR